MQIYWTVTLRHWILGVVSSSEPLIYFQSGRACDEYLGSIRDVLEQVVTACVMGAIFL